MKDDIEQIRDAVIKEAFVLVDRFKETLEKSGEEVAFRGIDLNSLGLAVEALRTRETDTCSLCKQTRAWHQEHRPRHMFEAIK